jgi:hypothetical protein
VATHPCIQKTHGHEFYSCLVEKIECPLVDKGSSFSFKSEKFTPAIVGANCSLIIPVITLRDTPHWCIISLIVGPSNFVPVRTQQRKMCPPMSMISYMPWSLRFSNGDTDALKPNRYYEPRTQCLFKSSVTSFLSMPFRQRHPLPCTLSLRTAPSLPLNSRLDSSLVQALRTNKRAGTLFDLSLCFPPFRDEVEGPFTQQKAQKNARTPSATGFFSKPYKHHCWTIQFATSRRNRLQRWADS